MTYRIWIDTEFTSLEEPQLLSVGLALQDGREFYLEVLTDDLEQRCSDFARERVLPMFGRMGTAAESLGDLAKKLAEFLMNVAPGHSIELLYADRSDRVLVQHALECAAAWPRLACRILWLNVTIEVDYSDVATEVMAAVFERSRMEQGLDRHHALVDARALKAAYLAAEADPGVIRP